MSIINHQKYLHNPVYCLHCKSIIEYTYRKNKFCSRSCSASYNNTFKNFSRKENHICLECNKDFIHNSTTKNKFCSVNCSEIFTKKKYKQKFEQGLLTDRSSIKKYIIERDTYKCSCCHISEWMNKPISLQLDHIDGNPSNNMPDNFRLLCPNCHSQTPFYGAKNKGSGRKSRGLSKR